MPKLSIALLGPVLITLDGHPVSFGYEKLRALLAYLAIEAAQPVRREKLAALLWPDQSEKSALDNLRQALSRLRQALGDRESVRPLLFIDRETVQLPAESDVWVDVISFQETLAKTTRHLHRHPQACEPCGQLRRLACGYYRGPFLADLSLPDSDMFEDWAMVQRERLSRQAIDAYTHLVRYDEWKKDDLHLQQSIQRLLEIDPWNEIGHASRIDRLARNGQRAAAVSHYQKLRKTLNDELGIEPSPQLAALCEDIKGDTGALRVQSSPGRVPGMPTPLTPLVGRRAELAELKAWLEDPTRRLISVTGPGGVGKTRLVVAVVEQQAPAFRDGAAFISLGGDSDQSDPLADRFTQTLRLDRPVQDFLRDKDFLLVLDGFEVCLENRSLVQDWLEENPALVVLVASRQRLDLPGESIFGLGGLEVPPLAMFAEAEKYSAVNLFVQDAQRVNADFVLDAHNRASISKICRLVDGFPLAINLAAAWTASIPCDEIAEEITCSLDILSAHTESTESHRSVRAVFDQSWRLLTDQEQQIFPRLSVFRGGFDRPAAMAVAGADYHLLTRLVEKSFILGSPEGRFNLHDLLRQYGREKLAEAGEKDGIRKQHFEYYFQTAQQNQPGQLGNSELQTFHWLVREHLNLQSALEWVNTQGKSAAAQELNHLIHADFHGYGIHRIDTQSD